MKKNSPKKNTHDKKCLAFMKKHKKLLIIVTAVVLVIISVLFVSLMGKGSGEDICSKAINDNDYRTFYNQACATKGHPKDEFIRACEKSGKKFYDDPNSSSDECVSEEEYNNRVANDDKAKEEKEKKKAECEANEGKWDGYSCKNKEQLEAEAKAAEEKKKQEEAKKDEEETKTNESSSEQTTNTTESSSSSSHAESTQDNGESLPSDIDPYDIKALCERALKEKHYSGSISVTNHYAMGYPPYIYVIVGTMSGWQVQCQANWQTWTVKSLTVNGKQI